MSRPMWIIRSSHPWAISAPARTASGQSARKPVPHTAPQHLAASLAALVTLAFAALTFAPVASAATWTSIGPAPSVSVTQFFAGRMSAIAVSRTDPNRYFVSGADGGVWRTTNGGASWTALTDQLPTSAVGALALDPSDENVLYVGTGENNYAQHSRYGLGLYKTTDGGETWSVLAAETFAGRSFARILVHPSQPLTLYAAICRAGGFPELAAAKNHPLATGPVGVFRSLDGGVTWMQLLNGLPNMSATDLAFQPDNPAILYAGIGHIFGDPTNGIYKSTDGGESWTRLGGGLPTANLGRISFALAPSQPLRIYTLIARNCTSSGANGGNLAGLRSDDGGVTWTNLPSPTIRSSQATYGWYNSLVTVDPANPDRVFFGGVPLIRSNDAGVTWATVTPPHVDLHEAAWDSAGRLIVTDDGGIHRTVTLGASWEALNNGLTTLQYYAGLSNHPSDPNFNLGGLQDNGTVLRAAPAPLWGQVMGGDGGPTLWDSADSRRMFVCLQGTGNIFRSTDFATSFNAVNPGISTTDRNAFHSPFVFNTANPQRMLYATFRVYRSLNGGSSWSAFSGDLTGGGQAAVRALAMAASDANIVYAVTNDHRFLRSDNGGANFMLLLTDAFGWPRVTRELFIHPTQPLTVYLAGGYFGGPKLRKTTDGGASWTTRDAGLPDIPANVVTVDVRGARPVLYIGLDNGVYRSIDDGATWHRYGTNLPVAAVIDLILEPARNRLTAATQGRSVWTIPIAIPADFNGDGAIDFNDIDALVLALANPQLYALTYGGQDADLVGDLDGDNILTFDDIDEFIGLLSG